MKQVFVGASPRLCIRVCGVATSHGGRRHVVRSNVTVRIGDTRNSVAEKVDGSSPFLASRCEPITSVAQRPQLNFNELQVSLEQLERVVQMNVLGDEKIVGCVVALLCILIKRINNRL